MRNGTPFVIYRMIGEKQQKKKTLKSLKLEKRKKKAKNVLNKNGKKIIQKKKKKYFCTKVFIKLYLQQPLEICMAFFAHQLHFFPNMRWYHSLNQSLAYNSNVKIQSKNKRGKYFQH